ncbi:acyltransferase [Cyclobacterium roseum]|uniref:acyltransferase n=1 Tax=Cyclobacterium roseum TaxID=2666137 RepID=UPI0013918EBB|nr:acyltransferase [Cyclobacterium roseum]
MIHRFIDFYRRKFWTKERYARYIGVSFGRDCRFVGDVKFGTEPYLIKMGNHVSITNSTFITHDGGIWVFRNEYPDSDIIKPIVIGNNVFIGSNCIILPGVVIGDDVVIGANSIVTKDLDSNYVYGGSPAKKIKPISDYKKKIIEEALPIKKYSFNDKKVYLMNLYNNVNKCN